MEVQAEGGFEAAVGQKQREVGSAQAIAKQAARVAEEAAQFGGLAEAVTVGRVGDDEAGRGVAVELVERADAPGDEALGKAGALGVELGGADGVGVDVAAFDGESGGWRADGGQGFVAQLAPGRIVVVWEALKGKGTVEAGRDVAEEARRFDGKGAAAAHGVEEPGGARGCGRVARDEVGDEGLQASAQDNGCGQCFAQGGLTDGAAVSAAVQAAARSVEAEGALVAVEADKDAVCRGGGEGVFIVVGVAEADELDAGHGALDGAEHALGHGGRVVEARLVAGDAQGEARGRGEMAGPVDAAGVAFEQREAVGAEV